MRRYDLHVRTKEGKRKIYKRRPLPPRPIAGMVKAVGRDVEETLIARKGVWVEKRVYDEKYAGGGDDD